MRTFFSIPGIVEAAVDESINCVIVDWRILSREQVVRDCCTAQLEEVRQGVRGIIVDTSQATGAPPQAVQAWFRTDLFPALHEAGLRIIVTVVPRSPLTILAANRWTGTGQGFGFRMRAAESLEAARQVAATFTREAA
jgi:hypothetical protein